MNPIENLSGEERDKIRRADPPSRPKPMLAVLSDEVFSDPEWIFERKLDGERVLAVLESSGIRLMSRNGKDVSDSYPEVVEALGDAMAHDERAVLDGEVVAFSGSVTSFARLQERMHVKDADEARATGVAVYYYLFDLLHLEGFDVTSLPLRTRKSLLRDALSFQDTLRFTPHRNKDGKALHQEACQKGWEGIIGKDAGSTYEHNRSRSWVKMKCVHRQEMVIGGFTEPEGRRKEFGAVLVGYFESGGDALRYAGKVGTGFDEDTLEKMGRLLRARERKTPPFSKGDREALPRKGVHWVTPNLVGQFGFTEWTEAGRLRHPRFLGLRRGKDPREVEREEPVEASAGGGGSA